MCATVLDELSICRNFRRVKSGDHALRRTFSSRSHFCQCGNDLRQTALSSSSCPLSCDASVTPLNKGCCGGRDVLSVYSVKYYRS